MRLVLVRHADAVDRDPRVHREDGDRELTPIGRQVHARMAAALAQAEPETRWILTSPLLRARETAVITAQVLGIHPAEVRPCEPLGDRFSKRGLLSELARYPADSTVVVVGHAPTLGDLASALLHADAGGAIEFPKSGMLCLEFEGHPSDGKASLAWFLAPDGAPPPGA